LTHNAPCRRISLCGNAVVIRLYRIVDHGVNITLFPPDIKFLYNIFA
jgi:hypothetical protein